MIPRKPEISCEQMKTVFERKKKKESLFYIQVIITFCDKCYWHFLLFVGWGFKKDCVHILEEGKNSAANLLDAFPIYGFVVSRDTRNMLTCSCLNEFPVREGTEETTELLTVPTDVRSCALLSTLSGTGRFLSSPPHCVSNPAFNHSQCT